MADFRQIDEARKLLGWSPKYSLEVGLGETISWFKKNLSLNPLWKAYPLYSLGS